MSSHDPGPLTAHEAWAIVQPIVSGLDPQARLTFVTSGLDISHAGRSFTWEFMFYLPTRRAQALLSLVPADDAEDEDVDFMLRLYIPAQRLMAAFSPVASLPLVRSLPMVDETNTARDRGFHRAAINTSVPFRCRYLCYTVVRR